MKIGMVHRQNPVKSPWDNLMPWLHHQVTGNFLNWLEWNSIFISMYLTTMKDKMKGVIALYGSSIQRGGISDAPYVISDISPNSYMCCVTHCNILCNDRLWVSTESVVSSTHRISIAAWTFTCKQCGRPPSCEVWLIMIQTGESKKQ